MIFCYESFELMPFQRSVKKPKSYQHFSQNLSIIKLNKINED
jgi:hypothetical protein